MSSRAWVLVTAVLLAPYATPTAHAALIGAQATLSTIAHNVGGTVTVVDENTFRVDDFTYDGGGPLVYFYLGFSETNAGFTSGLEISTLLNGTAYDGTQGPLFFDLPAGETFTGYNAISVWCAQFNANFGSGTFAPIQGDLNGDGFVGISDLGIVLGNWNQDAPPADPLADPSGDGFVGIEDLNAILGNWNAGTPPSADAVPEPASAAILGCLGVLLRHRR
jgi:Electron transfer DM13